MRAREVLGDCRLAIDMASRAPNHAAFRVGWAAVVTLLRAVGHVLGKVDANESPALSKAIKDRWEMWRRDRGSNTLFWDFVEDERNSVLKEYAFGYEVSGICIEERHRDGSVVFHAGIPYGNRLRSGPFAGQHGLDVATQALSWWDRELDAIEASAREKGA